MAEAILDLRLDTVQPNRVRLVYGVQNDYNSRYICARFTVNGKPIDIEKTAAVRINAKRPDGNKDAFPGTVNTDGTAKVPVAQWMLDVPGEVSASITAVTTSGALTTQEFYIMAKASIWDSTGAPSEENPDKDVIQTIIVSENERVEAEKQRAETFAEMEERFSHWDDSIAPSASVTQTAEGANIRLKDKNGETTATVKSAYGSAQEGGFALPEAAFNAKLNIPIVTPQMFGAKGDGVTDDTKAFKKCFEYTNIYIPIGTYIISETIEVLNKTNVKGNTRESTEVKSTADVVFNCLGFASFSTMRIKGNNENTGIVFPQHNLRIETVDFQTLETGVRSNGETTVKYNSFEKCRFYYVNTAFDFESATAQLNTIMVLHCAFMDYGCVIKAPFVYNLNFDTCSFTGENESSYILDISSTLASSFKSCYIEAKGKIITERFHAGNFSVYDTWIYRRGVFLSKSNATQYQTNIKFINSQISNPAYIVGESTFDCLIDGTNLNVDIIDCSTSAQDNQGQSLINNANFALEKGIATNCRLRTIGDYLTLDTLPLYNGEVE